MFSSRPVECGERRSVTQTFERAVFVDRDGTLIEEVGYLDRADRVAFFPWTIAAVRALSSAASSFRASAIFTLRRGSSH